MRSKFLYLSNQNIQIMFKNVLKEIKTTIVGTALMIFGGAYQWHQEDPQMYITAGAVLLGVAFWFFPDSIIGNIKRFLNRKGKSI